MQHEHDKNSLQISLKQRKKIGKRFNLFNYLNEYSDCDTKKTSSVYTRIFVKNHHMKIMGFYYYRKFNLGIPLRAPKKANMKKSKDLMKC